VSRPPLSALFVLGEDLEWQDDALCAQTDPDSFYPDKGSPSRPAKTICRRCPVITECLAYALKHGERYGVWGGLSERERRKLRASPGQGARVDLVDMGLCQRGLHDFSGTNIVVSRDGFRRCLPCRRLGDAERNAARRRAAQTGTKAA
jgi:WhiB family redox-sensing transcriptional regulator